MIGELDGVVFVYRTFVLDGEDAVQILPLDGHESGSRFGCGHSELTVELGNVGFLEKPIGLVDSLDLMDSEFLRKAALPGSKASFASTPCLRGIGGNHSDPQI